MPRAIRVFVAVFMALLGLLVGDVYSTAALAISPTPAWEISSVAHPTNFSIEDNVACTSVSHPICDQYVVTLTNVGGEHTTGPVTIVDALPLGLRAINLLGGNLETHPGLTANGAGWACDLSTTTCTYSEQVAPGATLAVILELEVDEGTAAGPVTNAVRITGGGAASVSTGEPLTLPNAIGEPSDAFGIAAFGFAAHDVSGEVDTQAGDHPSGVMTTVNFNTNIETRSSGARLFSSAEPPKDLAVYLPLGLVGNSVAAARCTELQLVAQAKSPTETECPLPSRLGTITLFSESSVESSLHPEGNVSDLYNMAPETGNPAQLGLKVLSKAVQAYISVVHTSSGYALRVATPGVPRAVNVEGLAFTLFGNPRAVAGEPDSSQTFFTNPSNCSTGAVVGQG